MAKIQVTYPGIADAYIQVAGTPESDHREPIPGRYQRGTFHGREAERFELHLGDYWQGPGSSDARSFRERVEARDEVEPQAGPDADWITDAFDLFVDPAEFDVSGPDVKHFQIFDEANGYPLVFMVRRTGGAMEVLINSKRADAGDLRGLKVPMPFLPGEWNSYEFDWLPRRGPKAAGLRIRHNGREVWAREGLSLIEDDARSIYAKHGLYRSDVDDWQAKNGGAVPPVVVAYVANRCRTTQDRAGEPAPVPPVVVTPAPPIPAPASGPRPDAAIPRSLIEWVDSLENAARDVLSEIERAGLPHADLARAAVAAQTALLKALKG